MLIPKPLAHIFINHIDTIFFSESAGSDKTDAIPQDYIDWCHRYMKKSFYIEWSGGGRKKDYGGFLYDLPIEIEPNNYLFDKLTEQLKLQSHEENELANLFIETIRYENYDGETDIYFEKHIDLYILAEKITSLIYEENKDLIEFEELLIKHSKFMPFIDKEQYQNMILSQKLEDSLEQKTSHSKKNKV